MIDESYVMLMYPNQFTWCFHAEFKIRYILNLFLRRYTLLLWWHLGKVSYLKWHCEWIWVSTEGWCLHCLFKNNRCFLKRYIYQPFPTEIRWKKCQKNNKRKILSSMLTINSLCLHNSQKYWMTRDVFTSDETGVSWYFQHVSLVLSNQNKQSHCCENWLERLRRKKRFYFIVISLFWIIFYVWSDGNKI